MAVLDQIRSPEDVKALDEAQLETLCAELRDFITENVAKTGGHLASNLGAVELTVAIHRVFDTAVDRLVFDVGHQSYVHKILTGRADRFDTLRTFGGISGFPKPKESVHDAFIAGHASNSISVALGMARARTIRGENHDVIALLGDGALTGGLAYEALNDVGESQEKLIVLLNDNEMSIAKNVGGMARHLAVQRLSPRYLRAKRLYRRLTDKTWLGRSLYKLTHRIKRKIRRNLLPCSVFEDMGLQYAGPVDGHNLRRLTEALTWAKNLGEPVVVHVVTKKGKGKPYAEENPGAYHGVSAFDPRTGEIPPEKESFSGVFGKELCRLAAANDAICAITAAMADGTGLTAFSNLYPDRFFDVGIAEEHAASMAAGMAAAGLVPVFAVYSTFLQRSYDMLLHDVAISGLHGVFAVDRAGLVGADGETHHGIFDVAYLSTVPGMKVYAPASFQELRDMLAAAVNRESGPVAVRYPRGEEGAYRDGGAQTVKCLREGRDMTLVTYGVNVNDALEAAENLKKENVSLEVLKLGVINPLPLEPVLASVKKTGRLLVVEECVAQNCVGQRIAAALICGGIPAGSVRLLNLGDGYVTHGTVQQLRQLCGIDAAGVQRAVMEELGNG